MIGLRPLPFPLDTPLRGIPFASVDFEATGFAGPEAHVVEVAVAHGTFGSSAVSPVFSSFVRPGIPIPAAASRVHGILDEHVADAPRWHDVEERLDEATRGRVLIAYNVPADLTFWSTEAERHGTPLPTFPWICLQVVRSATIARGRPGKLTEVAAEHGVQLEAHGAMGDALALAGLVRPMMFRAWKDGVFREFGGARAAEDRYHANRIARRNGATHDEVDPPAPLPPPHTIGALLAWQRGSALYQERSWAEYRRKEGDAMAPACPWHALYGEAAPTWGGTLRPRPCARCGGQVVDKIASSGHREVVDAADGQPHACRS